uniref:Integrase catalytic domain-containing protein n=1 Tax=Amphimedon queenslandica TaxID=400682 RepID=A0A1X7UAI1_AMPQE
MELPLTVHGNKYVIVFMDCLTRWVEAFPAAEETSETIAMLLANEIIFPHEVPKQLSSDKGTNLLSGLMKDVYPLTGIEKINTT